MKQPIDERIIRAIQDSYHNGEHRALTMMYCEARHIAGVVLHSIVEKTRLILPPEREDEIIHDAASRFVGQYISRPGFWVDKFTARIKWDVKYFLFDGGHEERPRKIGERNTVSIDTVTEDEVSTEKDLPEDRCYFIEDLYTEHARGTDILLAIKHATNFRDAALAVADIAGKAWCYDRAAKLLEVYRMTRRRNGRRIDGKRAPEGVLVHSKG